jgi:CBS domain containing-hemolysin-like protein
MSDSIFKLGVVFVLVLLNAFFVAAEYSLVSVRPTRIDQLVADGNRMARLVRRAKRDPNRFISGTQLGVTMMSLGLGWVAEPTLAPLVRPLFRFLPNEGTVITSHLAAGVLAYLLITILEVVLGEQVPKMLALQRSEATILTTAGPVNWFAYVFRPLIALLYWLTMAVLKLFGLKWEGEHSLVYSETELKMLVTASREKGILDESEQDLIVRVFGFADVLADEVMVPRTEMAALPADATLDEVTRVVAEHGFARYPVYGESLDDIIGVFHTKDLYKLLDRNALGRFNLRRMARAPLMIPGALPIDDLLATMKRQRTHVAMVVDEYGGIAGMVTLEDILERIVGEVRDEFESGLEDVQQLPNGEATISGLVSIDEMNERFDLGIDDPIYNTIGGYVFGQLGRRPEIGDEIVANGDILRVEELDGLRIDRIHLIPVPKEERDELDAVDPEETRQ